MKDRNTTIDISYLYLNQMRLELWGALFYSLTPFFIDIVTSKLWRSDQDRSCISNSDTDDLCWGESLTQCRFPDQFLQDWLGPVVAPHSQHLHLGVLLAEAKSFMSDLREISWGLQGRDGASSAEAPYEEGEQER